MMDEVAEIMIMSIDANVRITCHIGDIYQQKNETQFSYNTLMIVQKDLMNTAINDQIGTIKQGIINHIFTIKSKNISF